MSLAGKENDPLEGSKSPENEVDLEKPRGEDDGDILPATGDGVSETDIKSRTATIKTSPPTLQSLTDSALQFLSTASNETLGACLAGLGACSYLVLGRVGLVLIGIVGGVALHASWEDNAASGTDEAAKDKEMRRRREVGLDVVARVLDWKVRKKSGASEDDDVPISDLVSTGEKQLDYSDFEPLTGAALGTLTDAVIRDYVNWWYRPILPKDNTFPLACSQVLRSFIISISTHLSRKRPADAFLDFTTNASSIMIVLLNEFGSAVTASPSSTPHQAIKNYLALKPDSNLANIMDVKHQEKKLRMVADDILQNFLDSKAYNCEPVRVFLKEVLAGLILEMTLEKCSQPEWINEWIIYLLEEGEPELLHAIDAGVGNAANDAKDYQQASSKQPSQTRSVPEVPMALQNSNDQTKLQADPMEEALREAKRLSQLMAEEDARREKEQQAASKADDSTASGSTTRAPLTPTSSASENERNGDRQDMEDSVSSLPHEDLPTTEEPPARTGRTSESTFTDFDQLVPSVTQASADSNSNISRPLESTPFTLHNANISIFDDGGPGDKAPIRSKPTVDYLIQIEPASTDHRGWMIVRKYADFETLHEVLRRISVIAGVLEFANQHTTLPSWKENTKASLRTQLEGYLRSALRYAQLAESEGMRRFLEKEQGLGRSPGGGKSGFGWPNPTAFETMGKGMLNTLTAAPKGAAEGGKAFFGDVGRAFSGVVKKAPSGSGGGNSLSRTSTTSLTGQDNAHSVAPVRKARESQESFRDITHITSKVSTTPDRRSESKLGPTIAEEYAPVPRGSVDSKRSLDGKENISQHQPSQSLETSRSSIPDIIEGLHLPPPPSEITDDYSSPVASPERIQANFRSTAIGDTTSEPPPVQPPRPAASQASKPSKVTKAPSPFTEQETQVAVELIFAVINELYTLSSAWNIRRTLLTAAKTFLLRPGNPNLEAIRVLIQESVIEANTSDEGIAAHILKLRENTLPTEEELKLWPPAKSDEEKEKLRAKARKLLVERGMPQALNSVMGSAASREALGQVFDILQIEKVARGMMFGMLLQGVRAITQ